MNLFVKFLMPALFLASFSDAFAYNAKQCWLNTVTKKSMIKKYEFKYTVIDFVSFDTTKDEGFFPTMSASSSQRSTMIVDPGITTGDLQSSSQYVSSEGDCSAIAELAKKREEFIATNLPAIKREIAYGGGEMVRSLGYLSGCNENVSEVLATHLQRHYRELENVDNEKASFSEAFDQVLEGDQQLQGACLAAHS